MVVGSTGVGLTLLVAFGAFASAQSRLPDAPGKDALIKVCGACHAPDRATAVRLTREGWQGVMADMAALGATGTDPELAAILDYVSTHFLGEGTRPLNINGASQIDLELVAGLLRTQAAAVLKYVDKTPCQALADLKKVPGLDYKKIEERKDVLVCFPRLASSKKK